MESRDLIITEPVLFPAAQPCKACGRTVEVEEAACPWCTGRANGIEPTERVNTDPEWNRRADLWLASTYPGTRITADHLIDECGLPTGSLNQIGAKFRAWNKAGLIEVDGTTTSLRKPTHGRLVRLWKVIV